MVSTLNRTETHRQTRQEQSPHFMSAHVNVGQIERLASVITGGALGLYGVARRSLAGAALAAIGGSLVYRGLTGHCPVYGALGFDTNDRHSRAAIPAGHGVKVDK